MPGAFSVRADLGKRDPAVFGKRPHSRAGLMRTPGDVPFGFEALFVLIEDAQDVLGFQLGERPVPEVMNEAVFGGDDAVARVAYAPGKIAILERADLEALGAAADFIP